MTDKQPKNSNWYFKKKLKYLSNVGIILVVTILVFSIVTYYDAELANNLNDIFATFLSSIIGILIALITFLAFYVQYIANARISSQFEKQQDNDHFYKMLELHKENINEFKIKSFSSRETIIRNPYGS